MLAEHPAQILPAPLESALRDLSHPACPECVSLVGDSRLLGPVTGSVHFGVRTMMGVTSTRVGTHDDARLHGQWDSLLSRHVPDMDQIYSASARALPDRDRVFRAFSATPYERARVVLLAQDPYDTAGRQFNGGAHVCGASHHGPERLFRHRGAAALANRRG
jgi:hypothetical protein